MSTHNHLTPTPVVDKNGVLTTRHKKTLDAPSVQKSPIPAVSLPDARTALEDSTFTELVFGGNIEESEAHLVNVVREDDSDTVTLAIDLLTSGSDLAQSQVRATLNTAMSNLAEAHVGSYYDANWKKSCSKSCSPIIKHDMRAAWNVGEVLEETGIRVNPSYVMEDVGAIDGMLHGDYTPQPEDRSEDNDYWRGLTILALTYVLPADVKDKREDAIEFAKWIATRSDTERVIALSKERKTFNVSTLQEVMSDQDQTSAPLRQGTL